MNAPIPAKTDESNLVDAEGLIAALFAKNARPSLRTIRRLRERRLIPYVKLGKMVYFDPAAVRAALDKLTVQPRTDRRAA